MSGAISGSGAKGHKPPPKLLGKDENAGKSKGALDDALKGAQDKLAAAGQGVTSPGQGSNMQIPGITDTQGSQFSKVV